MTFLIFAVSFFIGFWLMILWGSTIKAPKKTKAEGDPPSTQKSGTRLRQISGDSPYANHLTAEKRRSGYQGSALASQSTEKK